jgi:hypothetical protein
MGGLTRKRILWASVAVVALFVAAGPLISYDHARWGIRFAFFSGGGVLPWIAAFGVVPALAGAALQVVRGTREIPERWRWTCALALVAVLTAVFHAPGGDGAFVIGAISALIVERFVNAGAQTVLAYQSERHGAVRGLA